MLFAVNPPHDYVTYNGLLLRYVFIRTDAPNPTDVSYTISVPVKIHFLSISLPFQAPTLQKDSITTAMADCSGQPFQLLSLPSELQLVVYAKYLEDADFAVSDHPYLQAFSSLAIERTCRQVSADVRNVRELVLPRVIKATGHHKTFFYHFFNALASQPKYKWLREHVTTLLVRCEQQLKVSSDVWSLLVEQCPRLSNFDLTSTCLFRGEFDPRLSQLIIHNMEKGPVIPAITFLQTSSLAYLSKF